MKIKLVQMSSQPDRSLNLVSTRELVGAACADGRPDLIVLPEHFDWTGGQADDKRAAADVIPGGEAYGLVRSLAKEAGVAIHAGSLLERRPGDHRIYNTSVVFDAQGEEIGRYSKIHLFDITAPDGKRYAESDVVAPGDELFVYELAGFRIGCAICYDLRFSRLFDRLASFDVDLVILPAAFTQQTGQDHWEVLCRARAIEFQCFVAACGQCGSYPASDGERRFMFGHSLLIDPWGRILAAAEGEIGLIAAELDRSLLNKVRQMIPMREHRRSIDCLPVRLVGPPL